MKRAACFGSVLRPSPHVTPVPLSLPSLALGPYQRVSPTSCEEKHSLSDDWPGSVTRTNDGPGSGVAFAAQFSEDGGKSINCACDVLPEEPPCFALPRDADLLEEEAASCAVKPDLPACIG